MKFANFLLELCYISGIRCTAFNSFFIDVMKSNSGPTTALEFSCNKLESFFILKSLSRCGYQVSILPVDMVELPFPIPSNHVMFILNLQCSKAADLIVKANDKKLFESPFKWLIYYKNLNLNEIFLNYFFKIGILIDSHVALAEMRENNTILLRNIFKRQLHSSIETEEIGCWDINNGFVINKGVIKNALKQKRNLMGTLLKTCIVITHNDSLNHLTDKRDKHIDSIAKVNYVLVEHLKDVVNATLKYSVKDTWGYKNKEFQWNGMIGELVRKEADIGGTALFLTTDRVDIIDYIAMTTPTRSKFLFRAPKLSYVTDVFTLPFDRYVWLSTIALVVLLIVVLYGVTKWEWHRKKYVLVRKESNEQTLQDSILDVAVLAFGALCQQGSPSIPYSLPGRIVALFMFLSLMFLYTSYSANIVALLQSSSTSIKTLGDLLYSRLQVGVDDTVFNHFYFPNATEPIRRALYLTKVAPPGQKPRFMAIEEGIRRLRQGLFAFHVETGPGYKIVSETFEEGEKCGLQEIQFLQVPDPWLAIQKNSSYKKMLKIGLRLIQESGIQSREVNLIYTRKPPCISRGSTFISVSLVDCYPAAVVLASGIIISIAIFILELYIQNRRKFYELGRSFFSRKVEIKVSQQVNDHFPYAN